MGRNLRQKTWTIGSKNESSDCLASTMECYDITYAYKQSAGLARRLAQASGSWRTRHHCIHV